ncbi:class I SAM-dependent methyltransferase [Candidatus Bipolaricaulota bacterium]|nr:class I SAM-dependent methyltransferase [Candidatus Bipolaricaulota bacterium]
MDRTAAAYERLSGVYDVDWRHAVDSYLPLLDRLLGQERGKRILDLGCGTGLLAWELARRGHEVVGIDLSPAMINVARRKASGWGKTMAATHPGPEIDTDIGLDRTTAAPAKVAFSIGDMRSFRVAEQFDLVTCTFDALNYVTEIPELHAAFRCVRDAVSDHGRFVFDFATPAMYETHPRGASHRTIGSERITQWLRYDRASRLAVTWFRFGDDVVEMHRQRAYEMVEVARALRGCGMAVEQAFSGWRMRAYDSLAQRVICLAAPFPDEDEGKLRTDANARMSEKPTRNEP